jgi:hypothetical protein
MESLRTLEVMYDIRSVLADDAMNGLTMLTAYVVVCYLVGAMLSIYQLLAITVVYTLFMAGPIAGVYQAALDLNALGLETPQAAYPWIVPSVIVLGWVLSIAFMIEARRNPQLNFRSSS